MVPRIVLTRSGLISLNTARLVNTVQPRTTVNNAGPLKNVINNAYSTARRPFNKITVANNSNFTKKVNTVKVTKVNVAKPKAVVNTARPKAVLSAVKGNKGNAVKASAYYEEYDRGFVVFGGNSKGGKITGKGKIRTGKFNFEDVYFVKDLKFNLFSVSQMCDKKNSVLFTDIEYVVLSPDFKLTDESHVSLKVPREDNMYSVDLKNVVPQEVLTTDNQEKDEKQSQNDKTGLGMEKTVKDKAKSKPEKGFDKRAGPREEEQVFMDDLERLKKQEKEAYEEAEALRKKFETLVIKEGTAKPSSTNIFSTVSTPAKASSTNPLNTASIPVSTASPYEGLTLADPTHSEEDDSEIPPLEDIYQNSTDGIFTTSSFDDEGAVADFTNLETVVNVSPIPTSRIHSTHPRALILGDPNSAVQIRSKVNTSSGAHAFVSYVQNHIFKKRELTIRTFIYCFNLLVSLSQQEPKKIQKLL
ncbi:hypothetical protein Tco_0531453 [Tanacetum coccineum]